MKKLYLVLLCSILLLQVKTYALTASEIGLDIYSTEAIQVKVSYNYGDKVKSKHYDTPCWVKLSDGRWSVINGINETTDESGKSITDWTSATWVENQFVVYSKKLYYIDSNGYMATNADLGNDLKFSSSGILQYKGKDLIYEMSNDTAKLSKNSKKEVEGLEIKETEESEEKEDKESEEQEEYETKEDSDEDEDEDEESNGSSVITQYLDEDNNSIVTEATITEGQWKLDDQNKYWFLDTTGSDPNNSWTSWSADENTSVHKTSGWYLFQLQNQNDSGMFYMNDGVWVSEKLSTSRQVDMNYNGGSIVSEINNNSISFKIEGLKDLSSATDDISAIYGDFNLNGNDFAPTKLKLNSESHVNSMLSKDTAASTVYVKTEDAGTISGGNTRILNLYVGGTKFENVPFIEESDGFLKLRSNLVDMLENCYIDINEDNEATVKTHLDYAKLTVDNQLIQYIYYTMSTEASVDNIKSYYFVPLFLFRINNNYSVISYDKISTCEIKLPNMSSSIKVKGNMTAKIKPEEMLGNIQVINPAEKSTTQLSVSSLGRNSVIIENTEKATTIYKYDSFKSFDLVFANSIGNNIYLTNNISATSINTVINNLDIDIKEVRNSSIALENVISFLRGLRIILFDYVLSWIIVFLIGGISIMLLLGFNPSIRIRIGKRFDIFKLLSLGQIDYQSYSLPKLFLYILFLFVINLILQILSSGFAYLLGG